MAPSAAPGFVSQCLRPAGIRSVSPRAKVRPCPRNASAGLRRICAGTGRSGTPANGKHARSMRVECARAPARYASDRDSRKSGNARAKHRANASVARGNAPGIPCTARGRHQKRPKYGPPRIAGASASRQDVYRRGRSSVRPCPAGSSTFALSIGQCVALGKRP